MEPKDTEHLKNILTTHLNELMSHAAETVSAMTTPKENFPDPAGPAERAKIDTERDFMLRIRRRERHLAGKIRKALLRIENGTFGICEKCEEEIPFKRLEARAVTTQCIACKTKEEAYENARGA